MNDLEKGKGCGKLARERRWETQSKEREREKTVRSVGREVGLMVSSK